MKYCATTALEMASHGFAGAFEGQLWLIVINACAKWPGVTAMTSTTAEKTVHTLRIFFFHARYGIPDDIVTVNGPQLIPTTEC